MQSFDVLNTIARIARTNASVLITGESGTGKELIAEAIHINSQRAKQPFIKVNLGGISQSLFESEMFGHRKGAFTDAYADRKGRFELADKGTIFLDEIGDLDPLSQVKLLRVLQDQTFEPLGDSRPKTVDVRVVCATNRDLPQLIKAGSFREDLYYRLNVARILLPPLRERGNDILKLATAFVNEFNQKFGKMIAMIRDPYCFFFDNGFNSSISTKFFTYKGINNLFSIL
jgi:two-component system NtrC family response regulator